METIWVSAEVGGGRSSALSLSWSLRCCFSLTPPGQLTSDLWRTLAGPLEVRGLLEAQTGLDQCSGFGVRGSGLRVQGFGSRVQGSDQAPTCFQVGAELHLWAISDPPVVDRWSLQRDAPVLQLRPRPGGGAATPPRRPALHRRLAIVFATPELQEPQQPGHPVLRIL